MEGLPTLLIVTKIVIGPAFRHEGFSTRLWLIPELKKNAITLNDRPPAVSEKELVEPRDTCTGFCAGLPIIGEPVADGLQGPDFVLLQVKASASARVYRIEPLLLTGSFLLDTGEVRS